MTPANSSAGPSSAAAQPSRLPLLYRKSRARSLNERVSIVVAIQGLLVAPDLLEDLRQPGMAAVELAPTASPRQRGHVADLAFAEQDGKHPCGCTVGVEAAELVQAHAGVVGAVGQQHDADEALGVVMQLIASDLL